LRVLIYGVNSANKGAQLLLAAAASKLGEMGHTPVVLVRDVDKSTRDEFGAKGYFSVEKFGALRSGGLDRLPQALASRLPIAGDASFGYVLDASGFSLTDSWGMAPIRSRLSRLERWSGRGIGLSMLPQAFGPFERPDVAAGVGKVFAYADSIWARDASSAEYARKTLGTSAETKLAIAPDITIGLKVKASTAAAGSVLLVPNWNLAERSGETGRERYLTSLTDTVLGLRKQGRKVIGLSHEGAKDLAIIREVAQRAGDMEVLNPSSGLACKELIAGSELVVAGRYHALVSALATGVPIIGHSWSHKYQALMEDFGVADGLADPLESSETVDRAAALDLDAERARLVSVVGDVKERVETVWHDVDRLIRNR
jgi:polysaccharide pyruvyl transferase WcaK-like protein